MWQKNKKSVGYDKKRKTVRSQGGAESKGWIRRRDLRYIFLRRSRRSPCGGVASLSAEASKREGTILGSWCMAWHASMGFGTGSEIIDTSTSESIHARPRRGIAWGLAVVELLLRQSLRKVGTPPFALCAARLGMAGGGRRSLLPLSANEKFEPPVPAGYWPKTAILDTIAGIACRPACRVTVHGASSQEPTASSQ